MGFRIAEAFVEVKADATGLRAEVDKDVKEAGIGQKILVGIGLDKKSLEQAGKDGLGGLFSNIAPFIIPSIAAVTQLTGALGLIPAAGAAAGITFATLKIGLGGFSDAVKKGGTDLAALPPNAREAATAIRGLGPAWENLHLDVQSRLFQGVGKDVQRIGIVDLPVLRSGLDQTASALNQGVHYFTAWATSSKTVGDLKTIFDNTGISTQNLMRSLQPILGILRDVATVGSQFLPQLTSHFANAAQKAADFVSHARDTGQLAGWIQTGITATGKLWQVLSDLVMIIIKISQAPPLFGVDFLSSLTSVTGLVRMLVTTFPELVPLIGGILVVWKAWTIAQWALNAALTANPIGVVIAAIVALIAITVEVIKHWDAVKASLNATWSWIRDTANSVFTGVSNFIDQRNQAVKDNFTSTWNSIKDLTSSSWNSIKDTANTVSSSVQSFISQRNQAIKDNFTSNWNSIRDFSASTWNSIHATSVNVWNSTSNFLTTQLNNFRGFWSGAWNGIVGDFNNIWGRITGIASGIWNSVTGAFRSGVNSVVNLINGLVDDVDRVLGFLHLALLPRVPLLAAGGVLALAGGGTVGAGFTTNGPMAIVGEGDPSHPEYVIPTDPAHRDNALALYQALGAKLMAGGGILSSIENWVSDSVIGSAVNKLASVIPDGMFRGIASGVGHQIVDAVKAMIDKAQQAFSAAFTGSPNLAGWIQAALGLTGTPQSWAGPLSVLIGRESGGNPNAINLTDSNARAGHPSQGLMQTIPSTFNAYHQPGTSWNILDPVANIAAGINYIKARYGSIFNVQQANPNLPPRGYDAGGLLPTGLSLVRNATGQPERVLNATQTAKLDRLLAGPGRGGGVTVNVTQVAGSPAETGRFVALALRTVA